MNRPTEIEEIGDLLAASAAAARELAHDVRLDGPASERAARLARLSRCVRAAGAQLAALEGSAERTPFGRVCDEIVRRAETLREAEMLGVAPELLRGDASWLRSAAEHLEAHTRGDEAALLHALGQPHPLDCEPDGRVAADRIVAEIEDGWRRSTMRPLHEAVQPAVPFGTWDDDPAALRCPLCGVQAKWSANARGEGWAYCQDGAEVSRRYPGVGPPCPWRGAEIRKDPFGKSMWWGRLGARPENRGDRPGLSAARARGGR